MHIFTTVQARCSMSEWESFKHVQHALALYVSEVYAAHYRYFKAIIFTSLYITFICTAFWYINSVVRVAEAVALVLQVYCMHKLMPYVKISLSPFCILVAHKSLPESEWPLVPVLLDTRSLSLHYLRISWNIQQCAKKEMVQQGSYGFSCQRIKA